MTPLFPGTYPQRGWNCRFSHMLQVHIRAREEKLLEPICPTGLECEGNQNTSLSLDAKAEDWFQLERRACFLCGPSPQSQFSHHFPHHLFSAAPLSFDSGGPASRPELRNQKKGWSAFIGDLTCNPRGRNIKTGIKQCALFPFLSERRKKWSRQMERNTIDLVGIRR